MQITSTDDSSTVADRISVFSNAKDPVSVETFTAKSITEDLIYSK
jgi:hypothetical protein